MSNVYWGAHAALNVNANPAAMMLGDSWFWYPVDDLAVEIGAALPDREFVVIGKNGAEAAEWSTSMRKDIDVAFKMFAKDTQALLLSGGGNDFAGTTDFLRLIKDDCAKATTPQDCYRPGQPEQLLSTLIGAYRGVTRTFRIFNPTAPVMMHNYDYAWPTGKGVFGPGTWLKAPMDKARVPVALRRALLRDLLDRLGAAQKALAKDATLGPMIALKTAGTLPEDEAVWANELHPTPAGFKLIVKKAFLPALRKAIAPA